MAPSTASIANSPIIVSSSTLKVGPCAHGVQGYRSQNGEARRIASATRAQNSALKSVRSRVCSVVLKHGSELGAPGSWFSF